MAVTIGALLGIAMWSMGPSEVDAMRVALVIARAVVVVVAIAVWGSLAAWSWIVAALAYLALGSLRMAAYGAVWQERGAGALTLLAASALIVLIARRTARARQS